MADQSNLARPYAKAIFDIAQEQGNLAGWSDQLALLAQIAAVDATRTFINNPQATDEQIESLFVSVAGDHLSPEGVNLVKLLILNGRVEVLPDIYQAYSVLRDEAESVIEAKMTTASAIDDSQKQQFAEVLQKSWGRTVKLDYDVDEELIGGAVIRAGDWVVDGSVKAQLEQLEVAIGQ
jgi:F-type H+-transporting ATPase subunit delta